MTVFQTFCGFVFVNEEILLRYFHILNNKNKWCNANFKELFLYLLSAEFPGLSYQVLPQNNIFFDNIWRIVLTIFSPMIYQICDVTMNVSTWNRVHLWKHLLNHCWLSPQTSLIDRYKQGQQFSAIFLNKLEKLELSFRSFSI